MNIYIDQLLKNANHHFLNRYMIIVEKLKKRNLSNVKNYNDHHIIPRAFGGLDDDKNMVNCSLREHFILHHLLSLAFPKTGMVLAFRMMKNCKEGNITSREYEQIKINHYENLRNTSIKRNPNRKTNKGKIIINNGIKEKRVLPEELTSFLDSGWVLGPSPDNCKRISDGHKFRKLIGLPYSPRSLEHIEKSVNTKMANLFEKRLKLIENIQSIKNSPKYLIGLGFSKNFSNTKKLKNPFFEQAGYELINRFWIKK